MKEILLTKGQVALVDDDDFESLSKYKWFALVHRHNFYAARNIGKSPNKTALKMHHAILPPPKGMQIDHRDGNGLNNQRNNLRVCTPLENARNRGVQKNNTSGFKGVMWQKNEKVWVARIGHEGKKIHLGVFPSKESAHQAYIEACKKYHGDFANLK